jgi:beta-galactosidase
MRKVLCLLCILCGLTAIETQARQRRNFDADWLFTLGDSAQMSKPEYNDRHWRRLNLPHDWAIEGDFSAGNPSGAGGGALPGGVGWYRKHFRIREVARYFLEFDGVYMNSTVYINGEKLGSRPYGYSSFEYEITKYLRTGDNVIAVRVDNSDQPNSRWYSGCGIYRHVWFIETDAVHVNHWGVHVVTDPKKGRAQVTVSVRGKGDVENTLFDMSGATIDRSTGKESTLKVPAKRLRLWSPKDPYIYKVRTRVYAEGRMVDEVWTTTAFRDFRFDAQTGFWLNGVNMKLNGVCEHHDFGCLGAALNEDALHRKLVKLKQMGVNAIRSSHNPPAPELLNMCDTMGFIVMDESFDMWRRRKTQNDYARFFDEWYERDLSDLIRRDRNHPCIFMWSIGNEVLEQWTGAEADELTLEQANLILNASRDASMLARNGEVSTNTMLCDHLADIVRRYDNTRPITAGCNEPSPDNHLFKGNGLDIIGFNYHHEWIKDVPKNFPGRPFIMTESVSALQTTGFYKMPSDVIYKAPQEWWLPYTDPSFMCSAYDNMHASWSSTHEETWDVVKNTPYVGGQFIWTGFDYLGEPTPYGFPARSSYFGIIDLSGQPKDVYYMYQSEWTTTPVLHLFPHWNWMEGQEIDLWCYYNYADEVELFINGKSQGVRKKAPLLSHVGALVTPYHVGWRVKFEPGEVQVVARKNGQVVGMKTMCTAGQPDHLRLTVDYDGYKQNAQYQSPDKHHLVYVKVEVVDKDGNLCPWAEDQVFFDVTRGSKIVGVDNGSQFSMERFKDNKRKAFFGRCMVVIEGRGTLTAKGYNLKPASIRF